LALKAEEVESALRRLDGRHTVDNPWGIQTTATSDSRSGVGREAMRQALHSALEKPSSQQSAPSAREPVTQPIRPQQVAPGRKAPDAGTPREPAPLRPEKLFSVPPVVVSRPDAPPAHSGLQPPRSPAPASRPAPSSPRLDPSHTRPVVAPGRPELSVSRPIPGPSRPEPSVTRPAPAAIHAAPRTQSDASVSRPAGGTVLAGTPGRSNASVARSAAPPAVAVQTPVMNLTPIEARVDAFARPTGSSFTVSSGEEGEIEEEEDQAIEYVVTLPFLVARSEAQAQATQQAAAEPKPIEPKPIEPKPIEPKPTEPKPTEAQPRTPVAAVAEPPVVEPEALVEASPLPAPPPASPAPEAAAPPRPGPVKPAIPPKPPRLPGDIAMFLVDLVADPPRIEVLYKAREVFHRDYGLYMRQKSLFVPWLDAKPAVGTIVDLSITLPSSMTVLGKAEVVAEMATGFGLTLLFEEVGYKLLAMAAQP
jgi:hypothetical protein